MNNIIPHKWEVKKFDEIFDVVTDYVANGSFASLRENVSYKDDEDYAILVRLQDYSNKFQKNFVYVDEHAYNFLSKSKLNPNDLVICNVGAAGIIFKVPDLKKPMTLGPNSILVRTNESSDYMYYYIQSSIGQQKLKDITTTTAQPKFNKTDFKSIKCILPPLKEQQKIAEILSSVDAAIEKTEQVIAKTEEVKKGLMQQLLTKGIGHTEFVDTELGSLPSKWTVMNFMSLVNILDFRGRTPKKLGLDWGGNIPALSANNVRMGYIDFSLPTHYGNDTLYEKWMTKGDLEIGDLVLTTEAPAGNIAIINKNERYILSQRVIGIKVYREYLLPEYLKYYFMSDLFNKYLKQFSTGTTVTGISQKSLAFLKIPLPSLEEQEKISRTLLQYDSKLLNDNQYLKELKNLKSGLMQQLLTGQVRVKVD